MKNKELNNILTNIEAAIDREVARTGAMGTETVTVTLTLTDEEATAFLDSGVASTFNYDYDADTNELSIIGFEDQIKKQTKKHLTKWEY